MIGTLQTAIHKAKMGNSDKNNAIMRLSKIALQAEKNFTPNANFDAVIQHERDNSWRYGGRTVMGRAQPPQQIQLTLF